MINGTGTLLLCGQWEFPGEDLAKLHCLKVAQDIDINFIMQ